jgi:hypothetical protein
MIGILTAASQLDYAGWLRGLFSAGISSFSGAIASAFGPALVDPKDFNLQNPMLMIKTAAIGAAISGIVSMAKFLSAQPLPAMKEVTKTVQTLTPATESEPKTLTTVKEVHVEPIKASGDGMKG